MKKIIPKKDLYVKLDEDLIMEVQKRTYAGKEVTTKIFKDKEGNIISASREETPKVNSLIGNENKQISYVENRHYTVNSDDYIDANLDDDEDDFDYENEKKDI